MPLFGGLSSPNTVTLALLIAELWRHAGFYVIIFLANLALCDKALVEAASLDGANRWQIFRHVLIPQLRPAILINGIYALIPQRKHLPLRVRLWIDFLKTNYGSADYWRRAEDRPS